jgi:nicotinamidase-related amidase
MHCIRLALLATTASAGCLVALSDNPVVAQTIVDEWASVKAPPPPELKPVTLEAKTTGLLLLDFVKQICGPRPRCVASLPKIQNLASEARANGVLVIYSVAGQLTQADILPEVAPTGSEPVVRSGANKFLGTDLEKILKDKGIKTVVIVGTAAHGAILNTAAAAALHGFKVIVPIDGVSSAETYSEQYTAWHLANAPGGISPNVTLTKTEMIKF